MVPPIENRDACSPVASGCDVVVAFVVYNWEELDADAIFVYIFLLFFLLVSARKHCLQHSGGSALFCFATPPGWLAFTGLMEKDFAEFYPPLLSVSPNSLLSKFPRQLVTCFWCYCASKNSTATPRQF